MATDAVHTKAKSPVPRSRRKSGSRKTRRHSAGKSKADGVRGRKAKSETAKSAKANRADKPEAVRGRPSLYSEALADEICDRMASGESMRSICRDKAMPDRVTVLRWMAANENFATKCARARELQADALFDQMQEVADNGNPKSVHRAKLRVSTMQWRASKLAPKKYGDKVQLGGDPDNPVSVVHRIERVIVGPDAKA